jgi:hypothetical protein
LHSRDDLIIDVLAGKRIAGSRPCIGKVDIDERRLASEPNTSLESPLAINLGSFSKGCFKGLFEIVHDTISNGFKGKGRTASIDFGNGDMTSCPANLRRELSSSELIVFSIWQQRNPRKEIHSDPITAAPQS